jgi:hypothetical protein
MQATILDIYNHGNDKPEGAEIKLTFKYFIEYLQKRVAQEDTVKKDFFAYVLQKFLSVEQFRGFSTLEEIVKYKDTLTLLYSLLMPVVAEEKQALWALGVPLTPRVFFGTNAFYSLLTDRKTGELKCSILQSGGDETARKKKLQLVYSFILHKYYNYTLPGKGEMIQTFADDVTGLQKYFRVNIDTRFVEVFALKELPEINFKLLQHQQQYNSVDWDMLFSMLPINLFRFEGFTIITITDITSTQAIENIKNTIISRPDHDENDYYNNVIESLKILAENQHTEFHMLPALRVNGRLVFTDEARQRSLMVKSNLDAGMNEEQLILTTEQYLKEPKMLFYNDLTEENVKQRPLLKAMRDGGVVSYALLPVYHNNKIAGVLEAFSYVKDALDENVLIKVEAATPLLAQLLQKSIDEFGSRLESVIKEKFTSLQPAVQWKFNEVAWHFIRDRGIGPQKVITENILFRDVYPLYGAIDIRNSTIERNNALKNDLKVQLRLAIETLRSLKQQVNIPIADEMAFQCRKAEADIADELSDEEQMRLTEFLDNEVKSFLLYFKESDPRLAEIVDKYFAETNEETGITFANRRSLEQSMQIINGAVNQYLEMFKTEMQNTYPCYFEKFRTDGVEYDMYIGQSISPSQPFNMLYLKNIRMQQVVAMAAVVKITNALMPSLSKPLQTTQLIFIHSGSIDISFRNDERRFDVDGSYNIRYQVVKKRIDKANVKSTHERLTQPGKIAMVYFNKKDADEYIGYINYLQEQKILGSEIEFLELEELQGVTGLKALRVEVLL